MSVLRMFNQPTDETQKADPCEALRVLAELGTRDELLVRQLAEQATRLLEHENQIHRVREAIVDIIVRIEIESILGGPVNELQDRLFRILDLIVAKRSAATKA